MTAILLLCQWGVETSAAHSDFETGLAFDDVLLVPKYSPIYSRKDIDIRSRLSRNISIEVPITSSNMDVVTESQMAIAIARLGGIGFIHRFLAIGEEAAEVARVKRSEGILIENPITLTAGRSVGEAEALINRHGVGGIMVVDATMHLLGIVTKRDMIFEERLDRTISEVMTPLNELVTAPTGTGIGEAKVLLQKNKIEKLPIIDKDGRITGLITAKDITKRKQFPKATKDRKGRLMVVAAIGVQDDCMERAQKLIDAETDAIVVDIAHGHSVRSIETVKKLRKEFGRIEIIAGNVATADGTLDLINAGADAVKVGVGPGSTCTTRIVAGAGVPQLTAIMKSSKVAMEHGIPIIADGGVRHPGDLCKALAAGASTIMIGSLFAGTDESPGPTIMRNGIRYKFTRGMASITATASRRISAGASNANQKEKDIIAEVLENEVPEGVEGLIPYKGRVEESVTQLVGGLRSGMSYCGANSIAELQKNAEFIRITAAGLRESHPHDVNTRM